MRQEDPVATTTRAEAQPHAPRAGVPACPAPSGAATAVVPPQERPARQTRPPRRAAGMPTPTHALRLTVTEFARRGSRAAGAARQERRIAPRPTAVPTAAQEK